MADDVKINIDVETQQAIRNVAKLDGSFDKLGKEIKDTVGDANKGLAIFKGNLAAIGAAKVIGAVGRSVGTVFKALTVGAVESAKQIETLSVGFETLLGSADAAKETIQELQQFTATTPFRLESVAGAAQQLLAFGVEADNIIPKLRQIGDVAAGSNSDLKEVALIFGQIRAAGKLTGERLLQLQERAIPIGKAIADSLGVAEKEVRGLVSTGKVQFAEFEKAFASLSKEGGLFFEGTVRQSKTLEGVLSTLDDNFQLVSAEIGQAFLPAVKDAALGIIDLLQVTQKLVGEGSGFRNFFLAAFGSENAAKIALIDERVKDLKDGVVSLKEKIKDGGGFFEPRSTDELREGLERVQTEIRKLDAERARLVDNQKERDKTEVDSARNKVDILAALREEEKLKIEEQSLAEKAARDDATTTDLDNLKANLAAQQSIKEQFKKEDAALVKSITTTRTKAAEDARKSEEKSLTSLFNFEKNTQQGRAANMKSSLGSIATLQSQSNKTLFNIGKAAAIGQATIDGIAAVQRALASAPPPYNFAIAALVGTATALNVAKIASQKPPGFQDGGIVPGTSFEGDKVAANVNSGELILNQSQQDNIAGQLGGQSGGIFKLTDQAGRIIAELVRGEQEAGFSLLPVTG